MKILIRTTLILLGVLGAISMSAQDIKNSKHNLSASGTGVVKSMDDSRVCQFCHTSHSGNPKAPMWNRKNSGSTYTLYSSSTLDAKPGQPDGDSVLCLSCHDGKVALAMSSYKNPNQISFSQDLSSRGKLGTDLSNDHPISFVYDASLASDDGQLHDPMVMPTNVLDKNGKVQCTSCHDPHKDNDNNFLRKTREFSELCFTCHDKKYWGSSAHNTATNTWNGAGLNPWRHLETPYANVSQNGCASCHDTHNASGSERLLKKSREEDNCLDCHNGNVATTNIEAQFTKPYGHKIYNTSGAHDPMENSLTIKKHAECVDCHNPHASNNTSAVAPYVKGVNKGVKGIDKNGVEIEEVQFEYEMCFKCHSEKTWAQEPAVPRQFTQSDIRLDFNRTDGGSFHPVVAARNNPDAANNLIPPLTANSMVYCTDCHASDGNNSPNGPHGSNYPYILKLRYETENNVKESASRYALCYSCHNRESLLGKNNSFDLHKEHVDDQAVSCSTCHDPHGSPQSNLINFNTNLVTPLDNGRLEYIDVGLNSGSCYLNCHGKAHDGATY